VLAIDVLPTPGHPNNIIEVLLPGDCEANFIGIMTFYCMASSHV
jgi:hypothetical protein